MNENNRINIEQINLLVCYLVYISDLFLFTTRNLPLYTRSIGCALYSMKVILLEMQDLNKQQLWSN